MSSDQMEMTELSAQPAAVVRGHVSPAEMPTFLGGAFEEVMRVVAEQGVEAVGPPFGRYVPVRDGFDAEVGFPTTSAVQPSGRVSATELPGGEAAVAMHVGSYDSIGETYEALAGWLAARGCTPADAPWESYLDGPDVPEPRTLVHMPCRAQP
jgi:effector-binding domain-containing protein